jgi:hypothetical protein
MKIYRNQLFIVVSLFLFVVMLLGCSANKSQQEKLSVEKTPELKSIDKNALFDGETLDGWKITEFGPQGPVLVSGGKIILNYGDGCTGITWQKEFPKVNYEVTVEAQKTSGNDFFCGMTFPVNDEFCSLIVGGWGGPVVGLSCIDGKDAANNDTKILKRFDKNIWYNIKLQVTNEKIIAWVDDEKLVDFAYPGHELYVRPEVNLSKPFGICSYNTTAELRNIRLVEL